MKILFLDIDGVFNCSRTVVAFGGYPQELDHVGAFDWVAIGLVQAMCRADLDLKIVLSSAWRNFNTVPAVAEAFSLPIISKTGNSIKTRGHEIDDWLHGQLHSEEITHYCIVHDNDDMLDSQREHFVHTDGHEGLTWRNYLHMCRVLEINPHAGAPRERDWRTGSGGAKLQWDDEDVESAARIGRLVRNSDLTER